jgi:2-amino-4-hydroxy-6-hydroxymethyldihydropteridine diphosphokinase
LSDEPVWVVDVLDRVGERVFVGLGSNLGDRLSHLQGATASLPGAVQLSRVYETDPVGGPPDQQSYLNAVVQLATDLGPRELLVVGRRLEEAADRVRVERWGPRTLDVDVLLVGRRRVEEPDLVVPHPRMWERRFVLAPLSDLAPELVLAPVLAQAQGKVAVRSDLHLELPPAPPAAP